MRYLIPTLIPFQLFAAPVQILTDFVPTQELIREFAPADAEIYSILRPNSDPHHFQLKPADAKAITNADYIVYMSDGLTPWLPEMLENLKPDAEIIELAEIEGVELLSLQDDEAHDDHEDQGENDNHDHGDYDPHIWLSLKNLKLWSDDLALRFDSDQDHAAFFSDLEADIAKYRHEDSVHYIIDHSSLAYFDESMDAEMRGALYQNDAGTASAQHVRELENIVENENVTCVFERSGTRKTLAQEFANDNHLPLVEYDQMGASIEDSGLAFYRTLYIDLARAYSFCGDVDE